MLASKRQELMLAEVRRRGSARVLELSKLLDVSPMTVRRDLTQLDRAGLVRKVHGGASTIDEAPLTRSTDEPLFETKSTQMPDEKRAIAAAASAMIAPGSAIGVTAGTTTWQIARFITNIRDLTVVTNSLRVTEILHRANNSSLTVVLTGGMPTPSDAIVGPVAESTLHSLHLDQVFMGVHGMTDRLGFSTPNLMEARTNQAFVNAGDQLIVVADSSKWGTDGLSSIAPLRSASAVITDTGISDEADRILRGEVANLEVVAP